MNTQDKGVDAKGFRLSKKRKQRQKEKKAESFKKLKLQYEKCTKKIERITSSVTPTKCSRK